MAAEYFFREFQDNQQRTLNRAVEAYQAYLEAVQASRPLKGGMHWKKVKGREYLYKYRDRYGHGHSLGPRSPNTEGIWADFVRQRREAAARLGTQRQRLAEAARFCRAALINRVPEPVTRILRYFTEGDLSGAPLMVIGTQALAAYEFAAGFLSRLPRPRFAGWGPAAGSPWRPRRRSPQPNSWPGCTGPTALFRPSPVQGLSPLPKPAFGSVA